MTVFDVWWQINHFLSNKQQKITLVVHTRSFKCANWKRLGIMSAKILTSWLGNYRGIEMYYNKRSGTYFFPPFRNVFNVGNDKAVSMLISYASVILIRSQFLTEEEAVPQAPVMCGKYPSPRWLALSLPPLPFRRCKQYASPAAVKQHSSCSVRWSPGYYWVASSVGRNCSLWPYWAARLANSAHFSVSA